MGAGLAQGIVGSNLIGWRSPTGAIGCSGQSAQATQHKLFIEGA